MTKYSGITTNDWMKYIPEEVQLNELTITGTHDSATFARMSDSTQAIFKAEYVRCQERTISEQLTDGIRYLDLRGYDNGSNRLGLAHGDFCLDYWMDDALNDCRNFLLTNKSETIIICVSIEHGDKARFVQTWESNYGIKNSHYPWYTGGLNAPKLKDLRGKFYLLSKVGSDNQMLLTTNGAAPKWAFNSCDAGSPNPPYHIQDYCNVVTDGKHKSEVVDETMLKAQCSLEKNDFWINHVSCLGYTSFGFLDQVINADGIPTTPRQMAEKLNHGHEQTLQRMPFGRFGIIVMDFYNKYGSFLPRSHIVSNIRFPCDAVPGWFKLVSPFLGNSVLDANNRPTDRPYMNQADNDCTTWKLVHRDADGWFLMLNRAQNKYLDANAGDGILYVSDTSVESTYKRWRLVPIKGSDLFHLQNKGRLESNDTNQYLDSNSGGKGAFPYLSHFVGTNDQATRWKFIRTIWD